MQFICGLQITHQTLVVLLRAKNKYLTRAALAKASTPYVASPPAIISHPCEPQFIMLVIMCRSFPASVAEGRMVPTPWCSNPPLLVNS
jgi:hypothetical protein